MATINYLTTIQFGCGVIAELGAECARVGITRPLVVTDAGVRATGLVERCCAALGAERPYSVFDQTPSNPTEAAARAGAELFKSSGSDSLIAIGGGSSIDLAKAIALAATHEGPLASYAAVEGGVARVTAATAPVIAVPTTAGTGSEVGRAAVIILDDKRKLGLISPHLIPKSAICDPELTVGLPPFLTAATGMDAIAHCIETFLSPLFNPPADGIAFDGLQRAWAHIELAVKEPGNLDARLNMMSASMQGALAFQKGLGCVHSLSHALGGLMPSLHHGTLNAVFMPAVLAFNAAAPSVVAEKRMERLAGAMGLAVGLTVGDAIKEMNQRLGLPAGLDAMGVPESLFPEVITLAQGDHCHATNPRKASPEDYMSLLEASR